MRKLSAILLVLVLICCFSSNALAATDKITTTATGYTSAEDVKYITYSGTIQVTSSTAYTVQDVIVKNLIQYQLKK